MMNWEIVGAVGELIGAIAVVVSIGYLAIQVKQNTESVRGQAFQSLIDRVGTINSRTSDSHLADVVARGRKSFLNLTESEQVTFNYYMHERMLMYESALAFGHMLKDSIREVVHENILYHFTFPGVREWWQQDAREHIAQDFEDQVDELVAKHLG